MSKTLTQMRADLIIDLKDAGSLWSAAELNRCVERAYADLSRYIPREQVYEKTLSFSITDESFTTPLDTDIDRIVDGEDISGISSGASCTVDGQPDMARPLTATITDANNSITGLILTISGFDRDGKSASEVLTYSIGQSKTLTGKQYFSYISSVVVTSITGNGAGDVLEVGIGAYTTVWIQLANPLIKPDSLTCSVGTKNTDFYIDYYNGRLKVLTATFTAATAYTTSYKLSQIAVDLSTLSSFIRIDHVEYPLESVPQAIVGKDTFANKFFITGSETESQSNMAEGKNIRVYYESAHIPPTDYVPGTAPDFLDGTIALLASSYALLIYSLKLEHQSVTDLASARTALGSATTAQTDINTALTNMKKYLDNNSSADAESMLSSISTLFTAVETACQAANDYLDKVGATTTGDLDKADTVAASYIGATDLVAGATAPSIKAYLDAGDALINTITEGGDNERTPEIYAAYATAAKNALVAAYEQHRAFYAQNATARTNAALAYVQEAAQRMAEIRAYIDAATGYNNISNAFAKEAEERMNQNAVYLQQAAQYLTASTNDQTLSDRFKAEATDRRVEVLSIWADRKQYIGNIASASTRQYK